MANLKDLKSKIQSVKKTQKITNAMKMVAIAKLKKARIAAESSREYASKLFDMVCTIKAFIEIQDNNLPEYSSDNSILKLIYDSKQQIKAKKNYLFVLVTTDKGLCGGINTSSVKFIKNKIVESETKGYGIKILCIGKKGYEQLQYLYSNYIIEYQEGFSNKTITYQEAELITNKIVDLFQKEHFTHCSLIYTKFINVISQKICNLDLIPLRLDQEKIAKSYDEMQLKADIGFEPDQREVFDKIIPKNLSIQIYQRLLETFASEQGARMTAMDNAIKNCDNLIKNLTLKYNRQRQNEITTELIDIISGSESVK